MTRKNGFLFSTNPKYKKKIYKKHDESYEIERTLRKRKP
jgi:hypothetical protein